LAQDDRKATGGKARTGTGKQPISRHPLFPATVAIWFGALFGLGSLAIRPALLESAVLATHVDALVPAAAPPLGITARILLALAMAGIGGLIGATVARWINRPKQPKSERKRGAMSVLGRKSPEPAPRRRPLTIDESSLHQDFREHAPLPGGAPQILNVNDFAFDEPEAPAAARTESRFPAPGAPVEPSTSHFPSPAAPPFAATPESAGPDALDLAAFHQEPARQPFAEPEAPADRWSPPPAPAFEPQAYQPPVYQPPAFEPSTLENAVAPKAAHDALDLGMAAPEPYSPFADRALDASEDFGQRPFAAPATPTPTFPPVESAPEVAAPEPSSTVIAAWSQDAATAPPLFVPEGVSEEARAALAGVNAPRPFDAPALGASRKFDPPAAIPATYEPPTSPEAHEPEYPFRLILER